MNLFGQFNGFLPLNEASSAGSRLVSLQLVTTFRLTGALDIWYNNA
jgi:hypothetical protein